MLFLQFLTVFSSVIAFYIAFSIGSNDETMSPLFGSGFFTLNLTVLLGALMDFLGALFYSGKVEKTIGENLVAGRIELFDVFILFFSVATWLFFSSKKKWPVSTTHATIGAVLGLDLVKYGFKGVAWTPLTFVIAGWAASIVSGFLGAIVVYKLFEKIVLERVTGLFVRLKVTKISALLLLISSIVTAFFKGGNDAANATAFLGLLCGDLFIARFIVGVGIATGLFFTGRNLVGKVGKSLIELNPSMSFTIQLTVALTLAVGTSLGLPLSGTHVLISSIAGVGFIKRIWVNVETLKRIFFSWIVTFPCSSFLSCLFYFVIGLFHLP